jgi:Cu(I)/Ag(I) efflux system membrane fusion protein
VPREVRTGAVADDVVEIVAGLAAGETVVASAGFLVDAESKMGGAAASIPGTETAPAGGRAAPAPPRARDSAAAGPHAGMTM